MSSNLTCVLTTIQKPTPCVHRLGSVLGRLGGEVIVIGDRKGPESFDLPQARFYSIQRQLALPYKLARLLPEERYSRKNLGFLLAFDSGAGRIYETDDDNEPLEQWKPLELEAEVNRVAESQWLNVYRLFTRELIWPRGLPLDRVTDPRTFGVVERSASAVVAPIQQGLADGAPDVDAVWRLLFDREFHFDQRPAVWLPRGTWCPFNSQNTWWWPQAFVLMYLPSFCTFRLTDTWRSFVAQRCLWELGHGLVFHSADVRQLRNTHNLMRDFADEVPGYQDNDRMVQALEQLKLAPGADNTADNLIRCYEALIEKSLLPRDEMSLVRAWVDDWRSAMQLQGRSTG